MVHADHVEDEHESEDEQDVFALERRQGQGQAEAVATQTLDEAAADPTVSRGGWEGAAATQDVLPVASTSHKSSIDETADSLDSLMELTFDHIMWRCNVGQLQRTWAVMLSAFERTLLHTYRSKFTQFLVYYMCQQVCFLPLQREKTWFCFRSHNLLLHKGYNHKGYNHLPDANTLFQCVAARCCCQCIMKSCPDAVRILFPYYCLSWAVVDICMNSQQ